MSKPKLVVLTGAGISAESGIKTFRDHDGLWEGHDVMEVASPEGWAKNQALVLDFYNQRRRQLKEVNFNSAHADIATLEENYNVVVITQNVDDLHEKAGSSNIIHLHGELKKVRSSVDNSLVLEWTEDLNLGDKCKNGSQLRPHIVWFGESVPMMDKAIEEIRDCDICVIIGTSMQVYPAAGLVSYAPSEAKIYYIDPKPFISNELSRRNHKIINEKATKGTKMLMNELRHPSNEQ